MIIFEDEQERLQFKRKIEQRNKEIKRAELPSFQLDSVFGIADRFITQQLTLVGGSTSLL